jgi:hypothetical protein
LFRKRRTPDDRYLIQRATMPNGSVHDLPDIVVVGIGI